MAENLDSIIERLQKMIAHEASARSIGSIAEAEAFAEMIARMLAKYKLEMSDVQAQEADEDIAGAVFNPKDYGLSASRRVAWREALASVVAAAHYARALIVPGTGLIIFAGREADRKVALAIFALLVQTCERLASDARNAYAPSVDNILNFHPRFKHLDTDTKAAARSEALKRYKASFNVGFVHGIDDKYKSMREAITREQQHKEAEAMLTPGRLLSEAAGQCSALARLDNSLQAVDQWMQNNEIPQARNMKPEIADSGQAYRAGYKAAQNTSLATMTLDEGVEAAALEGE